MAWALGQEGVALAELHEPAALTVLERGLALARDSGSVLAANVCERELAVLLARTGRAAAAAGLVFRALEAMRRKAAWMYARETLYFAAIVLVSAGDAETSAALYGHFRSSSAGRAAGFERAAAAVERQLLAILGRDGVELRAARGEDVSTEKAVALAATSLKELMKRRDPEHLGD